MPLRRILSHPAIAKWQGRLPLSGAAAGFIARARGEDAMTPQWLTGKWVLLGLGVVILVVALAMVRLFMGGAEVLAPSTSAALVTGPDYHATYPAQVFTTKPVARHTVFTRPENTRNTFNPLSSDAIAKARSVSVSTPEQQATLQHREVLAAAGYSWSVNGFFEAARKGDLRALTAYLQAGMPVMSRNTFSSTALMAAAEANQIEAAKLLLAAGAEVDASTTNLQTPLHRAVASGFPAMTELLLTAGARPDSATLEGWTPLFYAVDTNNLRLVDYLVSMGARPDRQDRYGNTPLMLATRKNATEMATKLIKLGASTNAVDLSGRTALHYAVRGGFYQMSKMLLENGSKAVVADRSGLTPMDIALGQQDLAIANLLLANGAKRTNVLGKKVQ
ncbi:MAG: ankyrin repeat domain-containing protein [Verrucomicrobiaceae bacterium]|nr:MAG: ankyrin repeat domain-containing protein [Verrucomicrobiaceae bacterium]